jgi:hypothetical protein
MQAQERIIELHRLRIENVCSIPRDVSGLHAIRHRALINQSSTAHIHNVYSTSTHHQSAPIQKTLIIPRKTHVHRQEINIRKDILISWRPNYLRGVLRKKWVRKNLRQLVQKRGMLGRPRSIEDSDIHAKRHRSLRDFLPYTAETENTKRFTGQLTPCLPPPLTLVHVSVLLRDIPSKAQEKSKGKFGYRGVVHAWRVSDPYP